VESLCLRSAITHGDTAWEAAIVAALHTLSRTPLPATPEDRHAAATWETAHRAFHLALVSACAEKWLLWFWNILADHSERYRKQRLLHLRTQANPRSAGERDVHEEHRGLVAAILERDADEACRRMDHHLQATEQAVAALLGERSPHKTPLPHS
jgi:DNA-binding GntR family transcriptional regulator